MSHSHKSTKFHQAIIINLIMFGLVYGGIYKVCADSMADNAVAAVVAAGFLIFSSPFILAATMICLLIYWKFKLSA